MLGFYNNFPSNIHRVEHFSIALSNRKLQNKLIQVLYEINRKQFSFEEIAIPTVPNCTIIFELGLADAGIFSYIDEEEKRRALGVLKKEELDIMDILCAVRYYKCVAERKKPLRFDYYLIRTMFHKDSVEMQIFHERGPRYISPEDLAEFLVSKINNTSTRRIMKSIEVT